MATLTKEIFKTGYRPLPNKRAPVSPDAKPGLFTDFKYPVNILNPPRLDKYDTMAVGVYTPPLMRRVAAYMRTVINKRFPERQFSLRKIKVKGKYRVVVYRIK